MHGIMYVELKKFVTERHGEAAWQALTREAELEDEIFTPIRAYPDDYMFRLVAAAEKLTQTPAQDILQAFGEFIVPAYVAIYGNLLKPEWRTLDIIEHTEETIHRVVRLRQPGAKPPQLRTERVAPNEVVLHYDSERRLCAAARGIARGIARHFGESLGIDERQCMHRGDPSCVISFKVSG